ncbi:general secretion pathway protein L [Pseudomonas fluorescens]|uniref:PilN domain-containing protein n=1 Tax=Pseudomonas fluorescens TaxID=294 RepID=UPI0020A0C1DF|nr:PilN domain-containing protein [Pseudomonas fluorescens]MCP1484633.1 general secretion pathway protein L [Pseudomonas fluorescens]
MSRLTSVRLAPLIACLDVIVRQWRASPAQRLWHLWLDELRGCLPAQARSWLVDETPVQSWQWPLSPPLATCPSDARKVLLLPVSAVMVQRLQMPLAVRDLALVVGYELDKFTPFPRDQLYYVARQDGRNAGGVQVTLVAIARERLDRILMECATLNLIPNSVDVRSTDGIPLGVNLLPEQLRPTRARSGRGRQRKLAWLCGGLLITLMLLWVHDRQQLLEEMHATVQSQRDDVAHIQQLRQQLANTRGAAQYLAQRKAAQPTMAALLSELTACLPKDTWIDQLEIDDSAEVSFSGQSAKASALIAHLKDCRSLDNPHFQGVIQPDADTGKDHFSLRAHLHQEAADASTPDTP